MRFSVLLLALIFSGTALADQTRVELLPLKHRTAEEVIPLLRPLVGPEGGLSGTGYQLILRTTPENLAQIREILNTIDTAPRRLRIIVRQDADVEQSGTDVSASGHVVIRRTPAGNASEVQGRVDIGAHGSQVNEDTTVSQQLMVLEGSPAYIQVGQSVPMVERHVDRSGRQVQAYDSVRYRDVTTGFYVLPRVHGDQVTLEINPHRQALNSRRNGQVDVQEIHTTVSARLGEWIDLGGVTEQQNQRRSGILYSTRDAHSDRRRMLVKVETVDY